MLATTTAKSRRNLAADDEIEVGIQVNGKLRDTIMLSRDCENADAEARALESKPFSAILTVRRQKKSSLLKTGLSMWLSSQNDQNILGASIGWHSLFWVILTACSDISIHQLAKKSEQSKKNYGNV